MPIKSTESIKNKISYVYIYINYDKTFPSSHVELISIDPIVTMLFFCFGALYTAKSSFSVTILEILP